MVLGGSAFNIKSESLRLSRQDLSPPGVGSRRAGHRLGEVAKRRRYPSGAGRINAPHPQPMLDDVVSYFIR